MCQQCQPHYTHWLISFIYMILSSKLRSAFWSHAVLWFSAKINLIFHFSVSVCNIGLPRTVCVDSSRIASSITHQHHLSPSHSPSSWPCDLDPASSWPLDFFLHDLWPSFQVNDLHIDIWPSTQVSDLDLFIMTFDFFTCMTLHTTLTYDLLFKFLTMTFLSWPLSYSTHWLLSSMSLLHVTDVWAIAWSLTAKWPIKGHMEGVGEETLQQWPWPKWPWHSNHLTLDVEKIVGFIRFNIYMIRYSANKKENN